MFKPELILTLFVVTYIIVFSYYTILRHNSFASGAWDLGGFEQVFWKTIHGGTFFRGFEDPPVPTGEFFGVHFSPIVILILPIYFLLQKTETLLVLQTTVIALAAVPLYFLAKEELNEEGTALALAAVYLLYPPLQGMNWFDFHLEAFLPLFFLLAFFFYRKGKWGRYSISIILLLSVVEGITPIVIIFGLYCLMLRRKDLLQAIRTKEFHIIFSKPILIPIITILIAITWLSIAVNVIYFINPTRKLLRLDEFGTDISSMIVNVIMNPVKALITMFSPLDAKTFYLGVLLIPLLFLPLVDLSFIISVPWIIISLLSISRVYWIPVGYQYVGFVIGSLFVSVVQGYKIVKKFLRRRLERERALEKGFMSALLIVSVASTIMLSPVVNFDFGVTGRPTGSLYNDVLQQVIDLVPLNESVATQNNIYPHLTRRLLAYPYYRHNMDYVLIDRRSLWSGGGYPGDFPNDIPAYDDVIPKLVENGSYGLLSSIDNIYLLKKGYTGNQVIISTDGYGLRARYYQNARLLGLFGSSDEGNMTVLTDETRARSLEVNFTKIFSLPVGCYVASCMAKDTDNVAGDFRFGIWDLYGDGWLTYKDMTLSASFELYELEFDVTQEELSNRFVFIASKVTSDNNTIDIDWWQIEPTQSDAESIVIDANFVWSYLSPFPSKIIAGMTGQYGIMFDGYLYAPQDGDYSFRWFDWSNDSLRMSIDNHVIINDFAKVQISEGSVYLKKGRHSLSLKYSNPLGEGSINLFWKPPWTQNLESLNYHYLYLY